MAQGFLESLIRKYKVLFSKKQDFSQFSKDLNNLFIDLKSGVKKEIISEMISLHRDIVDSTPWDTGLAQANWQIEDTPNGTVLFSEILEEKEKRHIYELHQRLVDPAESPEISKFFSSRQVFIFNNVDYIEQLAAGSSPQAGPGEMVDDNIDKHLLSLEKTLKETGLFK